MNDWIVEQPPFEEDLKNSKYTMLNQNGINKIIEIINEKDKEIERLNRIIQIKQNRINKLNKKLIRRDNIIEDLKAILKSKGYETYIPVLERSDKE